MGKGTVSGFQAAVSGSKPLSEKLSVTFWLVPQGLATHSILNLG